jgi:UDP-glucuronate 4-epimerase
MGVVLVTGAAGFIGQATARLLLEQGRTVVGVDNLNDYYDVRLKHHRLSELRRYTGFIFRQMDIARRAQVRTLFGKFDVDVVVNLAARAGVRYSLVNPRIYYETNVIGTLNLLETMRERRVAKIVLASTSSLYSGQPMPFREDLAVNTPISPYAASKKAAEVLCYTYHYLFGIDVSILRYFTVYGPAGRPDMSIFRFIKQIDEGLPLTVYGDGNQSRDFTYIDDIARGTCLAMKKLGYQVINLGGGRQPTSLIDVVRRVEKSLGKTAQITYKAPQAVDMTSTCADIEKAAATLGWEPEVSVADGVERTVQWHVENRDLIRAIELGE